jgi:hypothetical protein
VRVCEGGDTAEKLEHSDDKRMNEDRLGRERENSKKGGILHWRTFDSVQRHEFYFILTVNRVELILHSDCPQVHSQYQLVAHARSLVLSYHLLNRVVDPPSA